MNNLLDEFLVCVRCAAVGYKDWLDIFDEVDAGLIRLELAISNGRGVVDVDVFGDEGVQLIELRTW